MVSIFSVLAIAQMSSTSEAASRAKHDARARGETQSSELSGTSSSEPVVLASGVAVRAIALDSRTNVYLTNANAPDRIFTLTGLADLPVSAASNPSATARLALVAGKRNRRLARGWR